MGLQDYKPAIVLTALQFIYAGVNLIGRAALLQNMSSRVFVVYRQLIAFLLIAPLAFLTRRDAKRCLDWKSFWWTFSISFFGVTANQNLYFAGMYLASSSAATALSNLVPPLTFVMAFMMGLEKVHLRSSRSLAKIIGTVTCVIGAVAMALVRGPKLLNVGLAQGEYDSWTLGCLLIFGSTCCWSLWLILQAQVSVFYPDHLSFTAWMCLFAAFQSGILALFLEPDIKAWKLSSPLELFCCFYTGLASAVTFFAQAWCISKAGPFLSAMFNPLNAVIVTIFACIFLHEEMYTGSLIGALAVIIGLYIVLWGKAKDHEDTSQMKKQNDQTTPYTKISDKTSGIIVDLEDPLLSAKKANVEAETRDQQ